MADGLIEIIQPRLPVNINGNTCKDVNDRWVKIYDMRNEFGAYNATLWTNLVDMVEVVGERLDVKVERKVNRKLCGNYAATLIQRNVRMWLVLKNVSQPRKYL